MDPDLQGRFEQALRQGELRSLALALRSEDCDQGEIYCLFHTFCQLLRDEGRETEQEVVEDALDFISGYCSPNLYWFGRPLLKEELEAIRQWQTGSTPVPETGEPGEDRQ